MKIKNLKTLCAIGLTLVVLTGCSSDNTPELIDDMSVQIEVLEQENKVLEESVQQLEEQIRELTIENDTLMSELGLVGEDMYPIYTRDVDSWEIVKMDNISMEQNAETIEVLNRLAETLSQSLFENFPINVEGIETINGEQIVTINLKDKSETYEETWQGRYFQGSTGGEITRTSLEETFLQRDLDREWIDGIRILYNGEELADAHITLGNIVYRK